jgi:hypothetical protein
LLGQEDLAAAGDDAGYVKVDMDAEEREYHLRLQAGRERRASRMAPVATPAAEGAADVLPGTPPAGEDKPLFFTP